MSYLYGLDPVEQNKALDRAYENTLDPNSVKAGMFDGMGEAALTGLFAGAVAKPALLLGDSVTEAVLPLAERLDKDFDTSTAEWLKKEQRKNVDMVKNLRDRQASYGTASQIVNGFADMGPQAIAGFAMGGPAGAAVAVGGFQGYADSRLAMEDGVDPLTAAGKGAITGVTNAIGVALPMAKAGANLLTNIGIGVGGNVSMGMIQRGGTSALLEARGYGEMAKQYQWLDKEAIAIDLILGAAFGGVGHYAYKRMAAPKPEEIAAALTANEKMHVEVDTAPGVPKTADARDAHVQAQMRATEQLLRGETVDVGDLARRVDTVEMETRAPFLEAQDQAFREVLPKEVMDVMDPVPELPREVVAPQSTMRELEQQAAKLTEHSAKADAAVPVAEANQAAIRARVDALDAAMAKANAAGEPTERIMAELTAENSRLRVAGWAASDARGEAAAAKADLMTAEEKLKTEKEKPAPKTHDGTDASMAKAADVRPVENDITRQALERRPDLMIRGEDGGMVSAADALREVDAEIQRAQQDAALHDVAVACFLRG